MLGWWYFKGFWESGYALIGARFMRDWGFGTRC